MENKTVSCGISKYLIYSFFALLIFQFSASAPILKSPVTYDKFLEELSQEGCSFPKAVVLPFSSEATFEYLSSPLLVCKDPDATKRSKEAIHLCTEIFDNLRNITCHSDQNAQLPDIKVDFSQEVCNDISFLQFSEKESDILLKHLGDKFICDMMCDDEFKTACQVLLWSYQVLKEMESESSVKNLEPVQSEDGKINNNDSLKDSQPQQNESEKATKSATSVSGKEKSPASIASNVKLITNNGDKPVQQDNTSLQNLDTVNIAQKPIKIDNEKSAKKDVKPEPPIQSTDETQGPSSLKGTEVKVSTVKLSKDAETIKSDAFKGTVDKEPSKPMNENEVKIDEIPPKHNSIDTDTQPAKNKVTPTIKPDKSKDKSSVTGEAVPEKDSSIPKINKNLSQTQEGANGVQKEVKQDISVTNLENEIPKTNGKVSEKNVDDLDKTSMKIVTPQKTTSTNIDPKTIDIDSNQLKANEIPEEEVGTVENSLSELAPISTVPDLERMEEENEIPESAVKGQNPYNGDDGFYESSKNQKISSSDSVKMTNPIVESQNDIPKYDVFPPAIRRGPDDIQVIPSFPEQEDSHFFFYFLSLVLVLMAGYLVFHNKQKIIALIVEGRHERRRRSHAVGYKKLETK